MRKSTPQLPGGRGPDPKALAAGNFNPDREGRILEAILDGRTEGTNEAILEYLTANPPPGYDGKNGRVRKPTVTYFTKNAAIAGIIDAHEVGGRTVYLPLADGPAFARATPAGLEFRRSVLAGAAARPNAWLMYWKQEQVRENLGKPLSHLASGQLSERMAGSTIWIVSTDGDGDLFTLGPVRVDRVISRRQAGRLLPYTPRDVDRHVVVPHGEAVTARRMSLGDIVGRLRFQSETAETLDLSKGGRRIGQQLRAMRALTEASARLIERAWQDALDADTAELATATAAIETVESGDREYTTRARIEQQKLRRLLFGESPVGRCAICGETYPVELLVAAHVKPRAQCSKAERDDWRNNVVPMCSFGCDALFERGIITVRNGRFDTLTPEHATPAVRERLRSIHGVECGHWHVGSEPYFMWHASSHRRTPGPI